MVEDVEGFISMRERRKEERREGKERKEEETEERGGEREPTSLYDLGFFAEMMG